LANQPLASSTFLSEQISHQQPADSTFLSEQISTGHQSPAKAENLGIGMDGRQDGGEKRRGHAARRGEPRRPAGVTLITWPRRCTDTSTSWAPRAREYSPLERAHHARTPPVCPRLHASPLHSCSAARVATLAPHVVARRACTCSIDGDKKNSKLISRIKVFDFESTIYACLSNTDQLINATCFCTICVLASDYYCSTCE
jgi:hypothetical protein